MKVAKLLDTAADQPEQLQDALPALLGFSEGQHPLQVSYHFSSCYGGLQPSSCGNEPFIKKLLFFPQ